jgi:hypothetical protein
MKAWLAVLAVLACGKPNGPGSSGPPGAGSAPPQAANATTCDDVRPRVEQLYRADAQLRGSATPGRVEEAVADNTTMAMNDCAMDPARAVPCLARAVSVAELEKQCLIPLDEEGTEGDSLAR